MHRGDVHYSSLKSLPAHDPRTRLSSTSSGGLPSRVFKISQVYDGKYTARKCNWLRYCLALCDEIVALSVTYSEICLNSVLVQYCTVYILVWYVTSSKRKLGRAKRLTAPLFSGAVGFPFFREFFSRGGDFIVLFSGQTALKN